MSVLALGFSACDEYDEAIPQFNPQQPVLSVEGVQVAEGAQMAQPLDLNTFEGDYIELIKTVKAPELNEGTTIAYDVEISATTDFAKSKKVRLDEGRILKSDLDAAFRTLIGKTPKERKLNFRFIPYLSDGTSFTRIGQVYLLDKELAVTPIDLNIDIESAYYIVTDALFGNGWESSLIKLEHSDADVYDDPVFSVIANLPAGQIQFIGEESLQKAKNDPGNEFYYVWGADETGNMTYGENAPTVNIPSAGQYKISLNMLNRTASVVTYAPFLYAVGSFSGWGHSQSCFIYEREPGIHSGFVDMTQDGKVEFKFSIVTDWSNTWGGTNFGAGDEEGLLSTNGGAGNLTLEKGGIYHFTINTSELTWKADEITSWGVIGDAAPLGWDNDVELAYKGSLVWEGDLTLKAGKIKFRANHGWDINLGGSFDELMLNGADISVEAGTYTVSLDLSDARNYMATLVKK